MEEIKLRDTVSRELSKAGVTGSDRQNVMKFIQNEEDTTIDKRNYNDYLNDDVNLADVYKIIKNKKLTNNKIKSELRKLLKDPNDLIVFLETLLTLSKKNKVETKEETGCSSSGGYSDIPLFSKVNENSETTESTDTSSSGSYETPAFLAKSKKNWRGGKKTQIPGGKFVTVKDKCKKFPYCNQGDIKALNIFENETIKQIIIKLSKDYNIHEDHIRNIIKMNLIK
jgi:hypothetical protein